MSCRIVVLILLFSTITHFIYPQSPILQGYFEPFVIRNNQDYSRVILICTDSNVAEIHLEVTIENIYQLTLKDDGSDGDKMANDGKYTSDSILINLDFTQFNANGITPFTTMNNTISYLYENGDTLSGTSGIYLNLGIIDPGVVSLPDVKRAYVDKNVDNTEYVIATRNTGIDINSITRLYYKYFEDNRDFLVVSSNENESAAGYSFIVSNAVSGIGLPIFNYSNAYGSKSNLQSIIRIFPLASFVLLNHELLHRWAAFLNDSLSMTNDFHWKALRGNSSGFGIAWGVFSDIKYLGGNYYECSYLPDVDSSYYFNDLELYLMGLKSAGQIKDSIVSLTYPIATGFGSGKRIFYATGISTRSIQDIAIAQGGKRDPEYPNTQKKFKAGMIVNYDRPLTDVEFAYFNFMMQQYEKTEIISRFKSFEGATRGLGEMKTKIISMNFKPQMLPSVDDSMFSWNVAEGASKYRFQVFADDQFNVLLLDSITIDTNLIINTSQMVHPYYWRIKAINDEGESYWSATKPNAIPVIPQYIYPLKQSTGISRDVSLLWRSSDTDGDTLHYEVLFGNNPDSLKILAENLSDTTLTLHQLNYNTTYYWKVIVTDRYTSQSGPVWFFKTKVNSNPSVPLLISPMNDVQNVDTDIKLVWYCTDPDNDDLIFTIFLGNDSLSLTNIAEVSDTTYMLTDLNYNSKYYWSVNATDGDTTISSEIWKFFTKENIPDFRNEIEKPGTILIFPNPSDSYIIIDLTGHKSTAVNIEITDLSGSLIYKDQVKVIQQQVQINVSGFSHGVYFIKVYSEGHSGLTKFVIE